MKNGILKEQDYQEQMEHVVEPYLHSKERELWLEREHGKQIYVRCYQAKKARGVVLISHGFTETSEKYKELIYYFLRGGISCVYTGALWAWTQLSSGGGSVACTCGFLQAVCGRSFICGKDSEKRA